MSKDFEEEYRAYQNRNVPDLWSRIEAGIDAEEEKNPEPKKVVKFPTWKIATIVAACFAVIICIPSLGNMRLGFGRSKMEECTTANTTAESDMEETSSEEWAGDIAADCVTESTDVTEDMSNFMVSESEVSSKESVYEAEGAVEEEVTEAESESGAERDKLDVSISKVEEFEDEIRYTAVDLDTEEEIIILQEPDMPRMEVGSTYPVCVIKKGDIYYFEALVVE